MNKTVFDFQFDLPKIESWSVLAVGDKGQLHGFGGINCPGGQWLK